MAETYSQARTRMVQEQLAARGIKDPRVLDAMELLPREAFLPQRTVPDPAVVYRDGALPIGRGQTLSQPYMVAFMTQALELPDQGARVLEIGTGTGYQTALLAAIADEVWTVERDPVLSRQARLHLSRLGVKNVRFRIGDGSLGWKAGQPYHAILVTAGGPMVPPALLEQLASGGRLVIPVGPRDLQQLLRVVRDETGAEMEPEVLMDCRFVPLVGEEGWEFGSSQGGAGP